MEKCLAFLRMSGTVGVMVVVRLWSIFVEEAACCGGVDRPRRAPWGLVMFWDVGWAHSGHSYARPLFSCVADGGKLFGLGRLYDVSDASLMHIILVDYIPPWDRSPYFLRRVPPLRAL